MSNSRFNKDITDLIRNFTGVQLTYKPTQVINKQILLKILIKASDRPIRAAYDLPMDAKDLSYASRETISILESRALLKGLYGYLDKESSDHTSFEPADIPAVRTMLITNKQRIGGLVQAISIWK